MYIDVRKQIVIDINNNLVFDGEITYNIEDSLLKDECYYMPLLTYFNKNFNINYELYCIKAGDSVEYINIIVSALESKLNNIIKYWNKDNKYKLFYNKILERELDVSTEGVETLQTLINVSKQLEYPNHCMWITRTGNRIYIKIDTVNEFIKKISLYRMIIAVNKEKHLQIVKSLTSLDSITNYDVTVDLTGNSFISVEDVDLDTLVVNELDFIKDKLKDSLNEAYASCKTINYHTENKDFVLSWSNYKDVFANQLTLAEIAKQDKKLYSFTLKTKANEDVFSIISDYSNPSSIMLDATKVYRSLIYKVEVDLLKINYQVYQNYLLRINNVVSIEDIAVVKVDLESKKDFIQNISLSDSSLVELANQ